ncbi:MAG TPA: peptidylprolyl isomerase [Longimicrobiales bacterium]|nr:peptidylprolyl isomerase [Longimicrobiales bacterium]
MIRRIVTLVAVLLAAPTSILSAQAQSPDLVDRVVAVVGDSVVLQSDVLAEMERLRASGANMPSDPVEVAELRRSQLDAIINELIILQAAERDSITVLEPEVQAQVDAQIAQLERQFGGRDALATAMAREGLTIASYRETMAAGLRRAQIRRQYMAVLQRDHTPPPVSDAEITAFFEERSAGLGMRPATIEFRQVVVAPEPSEAARQAALDEAQEVSAQLRAGEEFTLLARRHSDDPGSRDRGGDLGWFRRGRMVPAFERMAFALRPGEVSPVVESAFGFHIIRVDKVRGPERQARHILIRPELTAEDEARTESRAEEVAAKLRAGASLDSLIEAVHDDTEESRVGPALQDSLPAPYNTELTGAGPGEVVGPFEIPGTGKYAVARIVSVRSAGAYSPDDEDVRAQIRSVIQQEKLLDEVLGELRRRTYIDIRY